jgi:hypothetical protein
LKAGHKQKDKLFHALEPDKTGKINAAGVRVGQIVAGIRTRQRWKAGVRTWTKLD